MSEQAEEDRINSAPDTFQTVIGIPSESRPGMVAVRRRRSNPKKRRSRGLAKVDPRFRQLHSALLILVVFLLFVALSGNSFQVWFEQVHRRLAGSLHGMHQVRLEVVALIVALLILLYLTPGVETYVFKKLGIKRSNF